MAVYKKYKPATSEMNAILFPPMWYSVGIKLTGISTIVVSRIIRALVLSGLVVGNKRKPAFL
jgi:hypothetical protein